MIEDFLHDIYGAGADLQQPRYLAASQTFTQLYGPGDIHVFRAPGRVNLIGEHTDYNHGYVMPVALDKDVVMLARQREDGRIRIHNVESGFPTVDFAIDNNIPAGLAGDWGNYARGPAQEIAQRLARPLFGFDGLIVAQEPFGVPRGAGLSSSSALVVVIAVTLAHFNDWQPDGMTLAQLCSDAELYVGTRGGIMDQFISVMGQKERALFLDCRPGENGHYRTEQIPLPPAYTLLIVNSGVKHRNVGGGYNQRVAACRASVALLQNHYPGITHLRDVEDVAWDELSPLLPEEIGVSELRTAGIDLGNIPGITSDVTGDAPGVALKVNARCRHVWSENWRVRDAVEALYAGDVAQLGRLMTAAHASARDNYEVSCPELDILVGLLDESPGVVTSRLTGAGWGGCVVALVEDEAVGAATQHVRTGYYSATGIDPDIFACQPGGGAAYVGKLPNEVKEK